MPLSEHKFLSISMKESISWEADSRHVAHKTSFPFNIKAQKNPPLNPTLSQMNMVHTHPNPLQLIVILSFVQYIIFQVLSLLEIL